MSTNYFDGLLGISFGVFIQKGPQSELCSATPNLQPGFVDRPSHQSFVETIFSTSPYCSSETIISPHIGALNTLEK